MRQLTCFIRIMEDEHSDFPATVRFVQHGNVYFGAGFTAASFQFMNTETDPHKRLTDREWQLLQLIAENKGNNKLSTVLHVSTNTALTHRVNLMRKLNVHNVASLVRLAVRWGMISCAHSLRLEPYALLCSGGCERV